MNEIINSTYPQDEMYDAFEGIEERVYLTMNDIDNRYYRVIITEIPFEEYENDPKN
jgi:hypothetical protein